MCAALVADVGCCCRPWAGLLASFSFTVLFSVCSLIAGRAVDVISRKAVTVGSCAVWSTMAFGTAFSNSFLEVFGLRVLQGSAQAFTVRAIDERGYLRGSRVCPARALKVVSVPNSNSSSSSR